MSGKDQGYTIRQKFLTLHSKARIEGMVYVYDINITNTQLDQLREHFQEELEEGFRDLKEHLDDLRNT